MAQVKSVSLNKNRTEEFLKSLDEKPSGRSAMIFQAIIASLVVHIFILFVTHMLTEDPRSILADDEVVYEELAMDMIEEEKIPELPQPEENSPQNSQLRNLIANENAERSSEARDYRGMSKAQLNEQVYNELKNLEAEEFARLNERRDDYTVNQKQSGQSDNSSPKKSEYDWYREKQNNKSYNGRVTASFNMKGRDPLDNPVPTYRCKTQGQVVVLISINNLGQVVGARIDETKSAADDCLRTESEKYALKWKFDYSAENKKQDGSITFTFSAQ